MDKPEFTALQLSLLLRTQPSDTAAIQSHLDGVEFQQALQEMLGHWLKEHLRAADVPFDELIISLDTPPQRAHAKESAKPSMLKRLFGG